MDLPITALLNAETSYGWLLRHFHPNGLHCVHCGAPVDNARHFRTTKRSRVPVYRCKQCQGIYSLYSGRCFTAPIYGRRK